MIFLLNCAVKVSLILVVTLIAVRLLRRQSAALRHCVLAAGIFSAAITPGLSALIPGWTWNAVVEPPPTATDSTQSPSTSFVPMPLPRPSASDAPKPQQAAGTSPATSLAASPAPAVSAGRGWFSYSLSVFETLGLLWAAGFVISL